MNQVLAARTLAVVLTVFIFIAYFIQRNTLGTLELLGLQLVPSTLEMQIENAFRAYALPQNTAIKQRFVPSEFALSELATTPYHFVFESNCNCLLAQGSEPKLQSTMGIEAPQFKETFAQFEGLESELARLSHSSVATLVLSFSALVLFFLQAEGKTIALRSKTTVKQATPTPATLKLKDFGYFTLRLQRTIANPFVSHQCLIALEPDVFRLHKGKHLDIEADFAATLAQICEHGPLPSVYHHPGLKFPVFLIHCPNYDSSNAVSLVNSLRAKIEEKTFLSQERTRMFCAGIALWEHSKSPYRNNNIKTIEFVRGALAALKAAQNKGIGQTFVSAVFEDQAESGADFGADFDDDRAGAL